MEECESGDQLALARPPGYRFYPSEDQLFVFYLMNKNMDPSPQDLCNAIKELDLYRHFPPELPDAVCFPYGFGGSKRHWYCYTARVAYRKQRNRRTRGGFWRRRGGVKEVAVEGGSEGNAVSGTRTRFVFYAGNSAMAAIKTDWIMSEYALADHFEASFVLCRVYVKANRGNSVTSTVMASRGDNCGLQAPDLWEELNINISIDCNISIGPLPASPSNDYAILEPVPEAGPQFDMDNQLEDHAIPEAGPQFLMDNHTIPVPVPEAGPQFHMDHQLDDHAIPIPVPEPSLQFHVDNCLDNHVIPGPVPAGPHFYMDLLNELVAVLEEDYIELDDLGTP
ncbi:hypothetical protein SAY87_004919 [Trapa incisa]|uniref:NAC domain-containing protein n=1 Tax=Trapa incisa TaxID=236973 RepID=A0AAN7JPX8_9MYRT|nr:hypothetical protein SAY87_004919 [Trapa incisa]